MARTQRVIDQKVVMLSQRECMDAATEGCRRYIQDRFDEVADRRRDIDQDPWGIDIRSCMAEFVYCKAFGLEWDRGSGRPEKDRLVHGVRIKHTRHDRGCLLIKSGEDFDHRFVLITGSMPRFVIRGWIDGKVAKRFGAWKDPVGRGAAWYIEQRYLWPLSQLVDMGYKQEVLL